LVAFFETLRELAHFVPVIRPAVLDVFHGRF